MYIPDFQNKELRLRKIEELENQGVIFIDKENTYIEQDVEIGAGAIIYPNVFVYRGSTIGEECVLFPGARVFQSVLANLVIVHDARIVRSRISNETEVDMGSLIKDSSVGKKCKIGPNAYIRDHTIIGDECEIGITEVARSLIRDRTKAKHGRYIGDAEIGENCNIGAGTVFCNYDGKAKHGTILGNHVFIGSGTMLVAPLTMADWSATGANTTLPKGTYQEGMLYYVKQGKLIAKPNPLAPKETRKKDE